MQRTTMVAALIALGLAACSPPDPAPPATADGAPPPAPAAPAAPSPAPEPAPTRAPETAQTPTPAASVDTAGEQQVNASIDSLLGDHTRYEPVIRGFQKAVVDGDKAAVAALVRYPISARIAGKDVVIANADAFVKRYDEIVTPKIADAIGKQNYADLMVNYKGVMFGSGEAWITGICDKGSKDCERFTVKVVTIQPGAQ